MIKKLLLLPVVLTIALVSPVLAADDQSRANDLEYIFNQSGVESHLAWVHSSVTDEAGLAWDKCATDVKRPNLADALSQILSPEELRASFLQELDQRIPEAELAKIVEWSKSETGQLIHKAEAESVNYDEASFTAALAEYQASGANTPERQTRLRHMLADTGAIYFLSAFNTEVSALVAVASVCSNDEASLLAADKLVREERGAEALYRSFMRQELIVPSSIVYKDISDAQLDALSDFAKSDAGTAYYSALIKGTRSMLSAKLDRLRETLETLPASD